MLDKDDPVMETLALTAKIEKNMQQLASNYKLRLDPQEDSQLQSSGRQVVQLQEEIKRLKGENKQLTEDNQRLCRDLLRMRDERRSLKNQLTEHKQYVKYLQQYLRDIKKEMLFWMRKPTEERRSSDQSSNHFQELFTQVTKLKKQNAYKELRLQFLKQEQTIDLYTPLKTKHKKIIQTNSRDHRLSSQKKTADSKQDLSCTSCNYWKRSIEINQKQQKKASHQRSKSLQSNLCECHRQYLKKGKFK